MLKYCVLFQRIYGPPTATAISCYSYWLSIASSRYWWISPMHVTRNSSCVTTTSGSGDGRAFKAVFELWSRLCLSRRISSTTELRYELRKSWNVLQLVIDIPQSHNTRLSQRNRVLLVLVWWRTYQTYWMLATLFHISLSRVKDLINCSIPVFDRYLSAYIQWPSVSEWQGLCGSWVKIYHEVGVTDDTHHEIYKKKGQSATI